MEISNERRKDLEDFLVNTSKQLTDTQLQRVIDIALGFSLSRRGEASNAQLVKPKGDQA